MTSLPLPGAKEAELMAKVGTGVLHGLQKAGQLPQWPDTREALLELHAILRDWCERAEETSRYARRVAGSRNDPSAGRVPAGGFPTQLVTSNIGAMYVEGVQADSKAVLDGHVPWLVRLRRARKRRAVRRGLRTILSVYCPELLGQFQQATGARAEWVKAHRRGFDRWFDPGRTDAEAFQVLKQMDATKTALVEATESLRRFIAANYPLPGANPNP